MDSKYQQYSFFISSGYDYLPEHPSHWTIKRNRQLFRIKKRPVGKKFSEFELLSLTLNGIISRDIESGKGKMPAEFDTYQVVEPTNIVFCLFDMDETPRTVGLSFKCGMITGAYVVAEVADNIDPTFIYYYYLHLDEFKGLRPFYTGLRKVVRPETFMGLRVPTPPFEEQRTIAAFLDYETARIDQLIAKQQQLIELLKEKRQAVISHAVTKGLNPNAPMKDSGVEWLGQVPEHWVVTRAKIVSEIFVPQRNKPELNDSGDGVHWATMEDMKNDEINETKKFVSKSAFDEAGSKVLKKGAVVASCVGNFGVATVLNIDVVINQQLQAYIPKAIMATYLRDLIVCSKVYFDLVGTAATLVYVNQEGFGNLPILLPPIAEQEEIEQKIDRSKAKFDRAIEKGRILVELLQERRTALISAAVTGKIDLRNWKVN